MPTGADVAGANVIFQRRTTAGTWTPPAVILLQLSSTSPLVPGGYPVAHDTRGPLNPGTGLASASSGTRTTTTMC